MKLEQQVTSLELSKKLRELGVKQDSLFWWNAKSIYEKEKPKWEYELMYVDGNVYNSRFQISAFTVAELGEMFPGNFSGKYVSLNKGMMGNRYYATLMEIDIAEDKELFQVEEKTEADARAKMLIYLLENKLITL